MWILRVRVAPGSSSRSSQEFGRARRRNRRVPPARWWPGWSEGPARAGGEGGGCFAGASWPFFVLGSCLRPHRALLQRAEGAARLASSIAFGNLRGATHHPRHPSPGTAGFGPYGMYPGPRRRVFPHPAGDRRLPPARGSHPSCGYGLAFGDPARLPPALVAHPGSSTGCRAPAPKRLNGFPSSPTNLTRAVFLGPPLGCANPELRPRALGVIVLARRASTSAGSRLLHRLGVFNRPPIPIPAGFQAIQQRCSPEAPRALCLGRGPISTTSARELRQACDDASVGVGLLGIAAGASIRPNRSVRSCSATSLISATRTSRCCSSGARPSFPACKPSPQALEAALLGPRSRPSSAWAVGLCSASGVDGLGATNLLPPAKKPSSAYLAGLSRPPRH